jgi:Ca2+-binding RTX toxin-like protein
MSIDVATYLKYANLQMAAESLFGTTNVDLPGAVKLADSMNVDSLIAGNNRTSKFTVTQANQFIADGWAVVEHISNTATGFSGTLFKNTQTNELTISFRSTEFIDDAARDNQATNDLEIRSFGWAFGQISDMESWYQSLKTKYSTEFTAAQGKVAVTGYSLGGHLATAFSELRIEDGTFNSQVSGVYTLNGAGVGKLNQGQTLSQVMSVFNSRRSFWSNADLFDNGVVRSLYQELAVSFRAETLSTAADARTAIDRIDLLLLGLGPQSSSREQALLLKEAMKRIYAVAFESERVAGLPSGGASGTEAKGVTNEKIEATALDYQLAVLKAKEGTASFGDINAAKKTLNLIDRDTYSLSKIFDIYGDTTYSMVSNSQQHFGETTPIWIEDQPEARGSIKKEVIEASTIKGGIKLLTPGFSLNDFGDTHSLSLIVDSLSVQNTLVQLAPGMDTAKLGSLLNAASNAKVETGFLSDVGVNNQGKADGDTLEKVVNTLAKLLGVPGGTLKGNLSGGSWAETGDKGGYTGRDAFQKLVSDIDSKIKTDELAGKFAISTTHDAKIAETDFAALVSLLSGATFSLRAKDEAAKGVINTKLGVTYSAELALFAADQIARAQGQAFALNYTESYLRDRSALLNWQIQADTKNLQPNSEFVTRVEAPSAYGVKTHFIDQVGQQQINVGDQTGITNSTKYIIFGNDQDNIINGGSDVDHLYGGGGSDTISGQAGDDYLEGNGGDDKLYGGAGIDTLFGGMGDDTLDGGKSNDTLVGGKGNDTYILRASDDGRDTIVDIDGEGSIKVVATDGSETQVLSKSWPTSKTLGKAKTSASDTPLMSKPTAAPH